MYEEVRGKRRKEIKPWVQCLLWARSAGRCEFEGCNEPLWKSPVTQERVVLAEKAHIYAYNAGGARGNKGIARRQLNSVDNLMLVCPVCHKKIDKVKDGDHYTAGLLQSWKCSHEERVELVTGIALDKKSHVVHYTANIDRASVNLDFNATASAMFPRRYPAESTSIDLGRSNAAVVDRTMEFWEEEERHLAHRVQRVHERLEKKEANHLSFFALAPQPLLIRLGAWFPEVIAADVYAHHKSPEGWCWNAKGRAIQYSVTPPTSFNGPPTLVFALSSRVSPARVTDAVGKGTSVWTLSIDQPHNDYLKSRQQLNLFGQCVRPLLDEIRFRHGADTAINILPVMPAAAAVELGRVRSPKASADWRVFDCVPSRGGFIHALTIKGKS